MKTAPNPQQVLSSWKEIANYLRRDVRTVQRWEQSRGLPVHRVQGRGRGAVYAVPSELDEWWSGSPARHELVEMPSLSRKAGTRRMAAGALLLGVVGAAVWVVSPPGAVPEPLRVSPLISLPGVTMSPSLSPDGRRLVFTWLREGETGRNLHLADLGSGKTEQLTRGRGMDIFSEWSPEGGRIAYLHMMLGSGEAEVRVIDMDRRDDRLAFMAKVGAIKTVPAWSFAWTPDGRALVLPTPEEGGTRFGLARRDLQTGSSMFLTSPSEHLTGDNTPAFSPDGRSIVFQRRTVSGEGMLFLLGLRVDGTPDGKPRPLSPGACCQGEPSWTRDGSEIVFTLTQNGVRRLMRVSAQGGKARPELAVPAPGIAARIARNGWLVYRRDTPTMASIFEAGLEGGRARSVPQRLIASSRADNYPAFSADGSRIAFSSDRSGSRQIWVCDADGGNPRQLTRVQGGAAIAPAWSPSGEWIAFEEEGANGSAIFLTRAEGGGAWPIAREGRNNRMPEWSRTGGGLYWSSDRSGRFEIWKTEIDRSGAPGQAWQVTREGGFGGLESADGRYLYYSKEPALRSLWRLPLAGGAEEAVLESFRFNRYPCNVAAGTRGLYFRGQDEGRGTQIWFLPFGGPGQPAMVMADVAEPGLGLAVSGDDRRLLLTGLTNQSSEVLVVKEFR